MKNYDLEIFNIFRASWLLFMFFIFNGFLIQFNGNHYFKIFYYLLMVSLISNFVVQVYFIVEKRFEKTIMEKFIKEVEEIRKNKKANKHISSHDPNQNPQ